MGLITLVVLLLGIGYVSFQPQADVSVNPAAEDREAILQAQLKKYLDAYKQQMVYTNNLREGIKRYRAAFNTQRGYTENFRDALIACRAQASSGSKNAGIGSLKKVDFNTNNQVAGARNLFIALTSGKEQLTLESIEKYRNAYLQQRQYTNNLRAGVKRLISAFNTQKRYTENLRHAFTVCQSENTLLFSGYHQQTVETHIGSFSFDIIGANLSTTKVVVDTGSNGDCYNNCPAYPLVHYIERSNAYAGINGSYFCPADYSSCRNSTNTFTMLAKNKQGTYINSIVGVSGFSPFGNSPAAVFYRNSVKFITDVKTLDKDKNWKIDHDPEVEAIFSNYPMLLYNGKVVYRGSNDPKLNSRGTRGFLASSGDFNVYIGIVRGVTMSDLVIVLKALGMKHAINLDSGGSTALWYGGSYKAGPGRNIPNSILLIKE